MNRPHQSISRVDVEQQDASAKPSFEQFLLRHLDSLYGLAFRLTQNREQANDLLQEACLKAHENFHQLREIEKVKVWLFRILHRVFLSHYRQRRNELPLVDIDLDESLLADAGDSFEVRFLENLLDDEVQTAFDALPVEFREVIMLADIEELSYREIVEILNIPMGTVASRLYRGHSLLREKLKEYARQHGYRGVKMHCGKIRKTLLESSNLEVLTPELAQVKAHVHDCTACRAFLQQHEALRRFLKERLGSEKAPASVREEVLTAVARHRITGANVSRRWGSNLARYAVAAAVLVAVGLSIFYYATPSKHGQNIAAELIDDHIRYRLSAQAVEQATTDPTALSQWFNSKLDFVAQIPPLVGFELDGGRLCYLFDRRVALAFYRKPDQWVSLFVLRGDGIDLSAMEKIGVSGKVLCRGDGKGYQVVAWKQKDLLYAVVSDKDALALAADL